MAYNVYEGIEVVNGYKSFFIKNGKLFDGYDREYEIGVTYHQDGEIKYGKNGYHFCIRPEDTLSYSNGINDIVVCEIAGFGHMYSVDNEYRDIYDIHVAENFKIKRVIPDNELKDMIRKHGFFAIEEYIKAKAYFLSNEDVESIIDKLDEYEKEKIRKKYYLWKEYYEKEFSNKKVRIKK